MTDFGNCLAGIVLIVITNQVAQFSRTNIPPTRSDFTSSLPTYFISDLTSV